MIKTTKQIEKLNSGGSLNRLIEILSHRYNKKLVYL